MKNLIKFITAGTIVSSAVLATLEKPAFASQPEPNCTIGNIWFQADLMIITCSNDGSSYVLAENGSPYNSACSADGDTVKVLYSMAMTNYLAGQAVEIWYTPVTSCFPSGGTQNAITGIYNVGSP